MAVVLTNWPGAVALTMVLIAWICSKQTFRHTPRRRSGVSGCDCGICDRVPWCPPSTVSRGFRERAARGGCLWNRFAAVSMWMLMLAIACCALRFVITALAGIRVLIRFSALLTLISGAVIVAASWQVSSPAAAAISSVIRVSRHNPGGIRVMAGIIPVTPVLEQDWHWRSLPAGWRASLEL